MKVSQLSDLYFSVRKLLCTKLSLYEKPQRYFVVREATRETYAVFYDTVPILKIENKKVLQIADSKGVKYAIGRPYLNMSHAPLRVCLGRLESKSLPFHLSTQH